MSDEIFEVATSCTDVAELGQSYIDRVDGERILLPLPREIPAGEGVRFIVHLVDGTPAFAGSGRCVQSSDQGDQVAATDRFETLIDTLAFDERSLPVYEYIVAVRQLAYSDNTGADAGTDVESVSVAVTEETTIYASDGADTVVQHSEVTVMSEEPGLSARDSHESLAPVAAVEALPSASAPSSPAPSMAPVEPERAPSTAPTPLPEPIQPAPIARVAPVTRVAAAAPVVQVQEVEIDVEPAVAPRREVRSEPPANLVLPSGPVYASVKPEPLPTGILTRPAIAAHWAPAAPRPPQRSLRPSRFQTARGPLQIPAAPPRPELERELWVTRAERPAA
jgi:hypothetical protein